MEGKETNATIVILSSKRMSILGLYKGYIGMMENKMEATILK